ncbi:MAG: hypothetical protein JSW27_00465 [Phycisphaerales bacterium]|nr:MAG: hypothetical protein JSW27_00465 [Phycisphaerales bacterium]
MNAAIEKTLIIALALIFGASNTAMAVVEPQLDLVDPWTSGPAVSECSQTNCDSDYAYKIDAAAPNGEYPHAGNIITISKSDGYTFDWASNYPVCAVIVKAGTGAYVYYYYGAYSGTGLDAPADKEISHVTFCFSGPPEQECATISGIKFHDRNANGVREAVADPLADPPVAAEELLSGWTIRLWKLVDAETDTWEWVDDDITDENGAYSFTVYEAGWYKVEEVLQDHWKQTAPATLHHDFEVVLALPCKSYPDNDFGNIQLGSISGSKFKDCNYDGIWDVGEEGVAGWTVCLTGEDILGNVFGPPDDCVTTNVDGYYKFDDLLPGSYTVCEDTSDPDWAATSPTCIDVDLAVAEHSTDVDFGNVPLGSITACKFYDFDEDGVPDGENGPDGEPDTGDEEGPVAGVTFELKQGGVVVASGVTGDDGCVTFSGLVPGSYTLVERLDLLEGNWEATTPEVVDVTLLCEEDASEQRAFGNVYWEDETAWAANGNVPLEYRYIDRGNWATYVMYDDAAKTVTLFAGQTMPVGTVSFSAPVAGEVTITINLTGDWSFADDGENVKVQDYAVAPSGNPEPGLFDHKITAPPATITVPQNNYYGVHVDVERKMPYGEL